jgi:hypothetical protein
MMETQDAGKPSTGLPLSVEQIHFTFMDDGLYIPLFLPDEYDVKVNGKLTSKDRQILGLIYGPHGTRRHIGSVHVDALAHLLRVDRETVQRSLNRITASGLIIRRSPSPEERGYGRTIYDLAPLDAFMRANMRRDREQINEMRRAEGLPPFSMDEDVQPYPIDSTASPDED